MEEFLQNIEKILMDDKMLASDRIEVLKYMFERKRRAEKKQRKNLGERSEPPHPLLSDVNQIVKDIAVFEKITEHEAVLIYFLPRNDHEFSECMKIRYGSINELKALGFKFD